MLLIGEVSANKEVVLTVQIKDDGEIFHPVRCVLNTGFSGYLTLPASAIDVLHLRYIDEIYLVIAGNQPSRLRAYEGVVEWHTSFITVLVLEVEGHPNIGMRLLYGSDLHVHVVDGGFATVAAL